MASTHVRQRTCFYVAYHITEIRPKTLVTLAVRTHRRHASGRIRRCNLWFHTSGNDRPFPQLYITIDSAAAPNALFHPPHCLSPACVPSEARMVFSFFCPILCSVSLVAFCFGWIVYQRFLSPLAQIPGPFWASISRLWYLRKINAEDMHRYTKRLHDRYGRGVPFGACFRLR